MRGGMRMHTAFKTAWDRSRQKSASVPSRPVHQALERPASGVVCKVLAKEVYVEITGIAQRHVAGDMRGENQVPGLPQEFPIVKDTTPNITNPRLYDTA